MDGFNRVWTSPQTLPTHQEIADPTLLDRPRGRHPGAARLTVAAPPGAVAGA